MEEAQAVCDRVAIMDHAKILTMDTPAGLIKKHRNDPRVRAAPLCQHYVRRFMTK
jgi:ABC-2 type transport system ATP-binding protein